MTCTLPSDTLLPNKSQPFSIVWPDNTDSICDLPSVLTFPDGVVHSLCGAHVCVIKTFKHMKSGSSYSTGDFCEKACVHTQGTHREVGGVWTKTTDHVTKNSGKMGTVTTWNAVVSQRQYTTAHCVLITPVQPTTTWIRMGCTVVLVSHMGFSFFFDGVCSTEISVLDRTVTPEHGKRKKIFNFLNGLWRCYSMDSLGFLRSTSYLVRPTVLHKTRGPVNRFPEQVSGRIPHDVQEVHGVQVSEGVEKLYWRT
jgi:hypothetical protein